MDIVYSLVAGVLAILLLGLLIRLPVIVRQVREWIAWYADVRHLRTLPSPPRQWLVGHALKVSSEMIYTIGVSLLSYT